jgi:hypothetical protein
MADPYTLLVKLPNGRWTAHFHKPEQGDFSHTGETWLEHFENYTEHHHYSFRSVDLARAYGQMIGLDRRCRDEGDAIEITSEGEIWAIKPAYGIPMWEEGREFVRPYEKVKLLYSRPISKLAA